MTQFSIPVSIVLTSERAWTSLDEKSADFGIVRFHFYIEDVLSNGQLKYGAPLRVYQKPEGISSKWTESEQAVLEHVKSHTSIEKYLVQKEVLKTLGSEILSESTGAQPFMFGGVIRAKINNKMSESLSAKEEFSSSLKVTTTETFTIEHDFPASFDGTLISAPAYYQREAHIYLTHIDYLRVQYRRSIFGLRKKAQNEPRVIKHDSHPNRYEIGMHVATAQYWQFVPSRCCLILESDYKPGVLDPNEIHVCPPQVKRHKKVDFPRVPTLYQIARVAFPRKWIWRKSPERMWKEEELIAIEDNEVRGKYGWWYRHGPGS